MRSRKLLLALVLAIILILNTVGLGWSAVDGDRSSITSYSLYSAYSLYVLAIAAKSINQDSIETHAESILHLTTLTTIASVFFVALAILPVDAAIVILELDTTPALTWLWLATMALNMLSSFIAFTTPMGPPLHYPPNVIYSEKTVLASTNKDEENVCGVIGMSQNSPLILN